MHILEELIQVILKMVSKVLSTLENMKKKIQPGLSKGKESPMEINNISYKQQPMPLLTPVVPR